MEERNDKAIAGLRIAVGLLFLIFAEYKIFGAKFTRGGGFEFWINRFLTDGAYPFIKPLLRGFVLPHAHFFAYLVAFGEGAIGLSLTLGLWTRIASAFGLAYMLALLFSANYPGPDAAFWMYFGASLDHSVLAMCFAAFIAGNPERAWAIPRKRWKGVESRVGVR
jgi:thiosulfate dehydrogenase [quinone] large subunit